MGEAWSWIREAFLAGGLIAVLISVLVLMTGSWPPMVVIESNSMQHDENGEVGSIDAGDLVLVMTPDRKDIITFVEGTESGGDYEGYESHGMPGDVIIYQKNGGSDTPVIHRALLEVIENTSGGHFGMYHLSLGHSTFCVHTMEVRIISKSRIGTRYTLDISPKATTMIA